jgi:hypothetical protein
MFRTYFSVAAAALAGFAAAMMPGVSGRSGEIHHRYGPGHLVSRSIQRATPMVLGAVEQLHRRAARTA